MKKDKVVMLLIGLAVAVLIVFIVTKIVMIQYSDAHTYEFEEVTDYYVLPGDTLWGIVNAHLGVERNKYDIRRVIDDVCIINGINGNIFAGNKIKLPIYGGMK